MQELEKILEEIDETIERYGENPYIDEKVTDLCYGMNIAKGIIRKHMNDGWIPVEKEWPPFGQRLQATILHHEWVTDYDSAWVPEEEKIHHPEYTEVCEIYPIGEKWCYNCIEDDYNIDIAYIEPAKVLLRPVAEIIAWRPLPKPYRPEGSDCDGK